MGAKQTKIQGSYLPDIPTLQRISVQSEDDMQRKELSVQTDFYRNPESGADPLDPRSPSGCRTPISILNKNTTQFQLQQQESVATPVENPLNLLRKRFFKSFSYNLHDPRSPSMQLNRTPLQFDELNDKTLNLNDTFADLFVDSRAPNVVQRAEVLKETAEAADEAMQVDAPADVSENETEQSTNASVEINSFVSAIGDEEETIPCPAKLQYTPLVLQQQLDPRSPTMGVDRTPIIFTDDDEATEDAMLENILATLSLDLSNSSSVVSFGTNTTPVLKTSAASEQPAVRLSESTKPLANKHLERVRRNGAHSHQRMLHKQPKSAQHRRQKIFEDRENVNASPVRCTPKKRYPKEDSDSARKRTPLCCVKNQTHLRSRSVESSAKSLRACLPLSSFDDSQNSMSDVRLANTRIQQALENSLEF